MTMDLERGTARQWIMDREGVKRWTDTNEPVEARSPVSAGVIVPGTLMQLANLLPDGWTMQIDMQRNAGGVSLFGPFDDLYEPDTGKGLEADMVRAVQFANFREAETDRAVTGAWNRFVDAMAEHKAPNV